MGKKQLKHKALVDPTTKPSSPSAGQVQPATSSVLVNGGPPVDPNAASSLAILATTMAPVCIPNTRAKSSSQDGQQSLEAPLKPSPVHVSEDPKGHKETQPKQWVNLFKEIPKGYLHGSRLKYIESNDDFVHVLDSHILPIKEAWGHALFGYFAGKFPGKKALMDLCSSWKVKFKYIPYSSGWLVFKFEFESESDMESVLFGGPNFVFGRPLLLKEGFEFEKFAESLTPVWVRFEGLGSHLWSDEFLGGMASKIGVSIHTDMLTRTKEKLEYARVLIEIDLNVPLKSNVPLKFSNGKLRKYDVFYENLPTFCTRCKSFKHATGSCKVLSDAEVRDKAEEKGPCPLVVPLASQPIDADE
ncbi:LOW QUALITY PROTEIN: hypothetical protein V2J09_018156 [Rumex salicifolius]